MLEHIIMPLEQYNSEIRLLEDQVVATSTQLVDAKAENERLSRECAKLIVNGVENVRLNDIIRHLLYTLKNKPALTQFNWSLEYQPYIERLEKIAKGEMNR